MSGVRVYFSMSTGLREPVQVSRYTLGRLRDDAAWFEQWFGWASEREPTPTSEDGERLKPRRWKRGDREIPRVPPAGHPELDRFGPDHWTAKLPGALERHHLKQWRTIACDRIRRHRRTVQALYEELTVEGQAKLVAEAAMGRTDAVTWTPEEAAELWHATDLEQVPMELWDEDYERETMERMYEVLRGRGDGQYGIRGRKLTEEQAGAVVWLVEVMLDLPHADSLRLEVPHGHDGLASTDEYDWCSRCGAIANDDLRSRLRTCPKRKKCELRDGNPDLVEEIEEENRENRRNGR